MSADHHVIARKGAGFFAALALIATFVLGTSIPALAQEKEPEEKEEEAVSSDAAAPQLDETAVLSHFRASSAELLEDGRVRLVYDFSSKDPNLLGDWSPEIKQTERRIRWSQGYEGTWTTVEDGLIIADHGIFIHNAHWAGDVDIQVDYLSMATPGKKDVLGAIYAWDKGRKIVGSQVGEQCVRLSKNIAPRGRPIPAKELPQLVAEEKRTFGLRIREGIAEATRSGRVHASSEGNEKFTKGLDTGQTGLAWKGRVNGFIFKIVVEGKLCPEWIAENIPGGLVPAEEAE